MAQALAVAAPDVATSWFCAADPLESLPLEADVIVLCRAKYSDRIADLLSRAKSLGRSVLYDVDDLVFDPRYVHMIMETLAQPLQSAAHWDFWFAYTSRLNATMRLCDRFIVTTDNLRVIASELFGKPATVIPNFLNEEQIDISQRLLEAKKSSEFRTDGQIHVGYFSGSPSHNKDFAIASAALDRLLSQDLRVRLRVAGYLDELGPVSRHRDRIDYFPMQDFVNLQRLIASTEINIVPLQQNDFTQSKSNLKYFEAAAVATLSIASPTATYRHAIVDGVNGWLAQSYEWQSKLEEAVACVSETKDRYAPMALRAADHVLNTYSCRAFGAQIAAALQG